MILRRAKATYDVSKDCDGGSLDKLLHIDGQPDFLSKAWTWDWLFSTHSV